MILISASWTLQPFYGVQDFNPLKNKNQASVVVFYYLTVIVRPNTIENKI